LVTWKVLTLIISLRSSGPQNGNSPRGTSPNFGWNRGGYAKMVVDSIKPTISVKRCNCKDQDKDLTNKDEDKDFTYNGL